MKEDSLSKSYDPSSVERKWSAIWKKKSWSKAQPDREKRAYSIVMPPPNVTGKLHMGHALVSTVQDILIRFKRMEGFDVLWVPGTDHAGIATQTVVERDLLQKGEMRRTEMSREAFLGHCWEWKKRSERNIIEQIEQLGGSCDWSRYAFTMDRERSVAVTHAFKNLFDRGLIYQGDYLIHWDPVSGTALADDELEYEEREGFLWSIAYKTESGETIVVATTRPETLFGDVAVAVHPNDVRYIAFHGKSLLLPLVGRSIPLLPDSFVDPQFGTGAVKITPAHDSNDYQMAIRHNLEMINILNPDATLNERTGIYEGLSIEEARLKIVEALQKAGLLVKREPHRHRVALSYRSKAVIQARLSKQWFFKLSAFKKELRELVSSKEVELIPSQWENTYFHWIDNLRDWCISRQLVWGHRIPIWYKKENPTEIICSAQGLEPEKDPTLWSQDPDVLDTWFSSALWPMSSMGWPEKTIEMERYFPTSTLVTGHDILFFWVARMLLFSKLLTGKVPFQKVYLHGLIFAKSYWRLSATGQALYVCQKEQEAFDLGAPLPQEVSWQWEKMSKSKGNVLDPLEMISLYGTDAVRLALASSLGEQRQIDLDRRRFEEYKNFSNKLFHGVRFILMHLAEEATPLGALFDSKTLSRGISPSLLAVEDHWILARYRQTLEGVRSDLEGCAFSSAVQRIYTFYWDDFCAYYLETSKPFLKNGGSWEKRTTKLHLLTLLTSGSLRLLHPIAPFITEELFEALRSRFPDLELLQIADPMTQETVEGFLRPSCMTSPFPKAVLETSEEKVALFLLVKEILYQIRLLRAEMKIPPGEKRDLHLVTHPKQKEALEDLLYLLHLAPIKEIIWHRSKENDPLLWSHARVEGIDIYLPLCSEDVAQESARIEKRVLELTRSIDLLQERFLNPSFCSKAPASLVAQQRQKLSEMIEERRSLTP